MPIQTSNENMDVYGYRTVMVDALNKVLEVFCDHGEGAIDEVMTNAMAPIAEAIGANEIFVDRIVKVDGESRMKRMYRWDKSSGGRSIENVDLLPESKAITNWVNTLRKGKAIGQCLSDATGDERDILERLCLKTIIAVPIFTHCEFWGAIAFQDSDIERHFDEDCMALIRSYARLCANAIIRNEMELEIARQNEINKKIAKDAAEAEERTRIMLDATPLCCQLWTRDFKIIDCNNTALELFGLKDKQEFIERFADFSPEYQPNGKRSRDEHLKYVKKAFDKGRSNVDWTHILPNGTLLPVEITLVRVHYKDEYVVAGFTRDLRQIKKMEKNILRLETESEKIYYDPLTGIYNRRFFDENLNRVINTLSRSGGVLSVMMIDIDFFKNFNDTYGHSAGDECLKTVAEALSKSAVRADDFVARYGGDEFAVVLPNTEEDGARMIAEKMIQNVRVCNIPHENSSVTSTVTISIGVTTSKVEARRRADAYILRADELLYKSKQSGRNRYTFGDL